MLLPQRLAETVRVEPSGAERQWYADLTARVRAEGRTTTSAQRLALRSVAKLAGSSPAAAAPTLAKIGWDDLARRGSLLTAPAKVAVLLDRLGRFTQAGQKVLVFTAFRQTLELLTAGPGRCGLPRQPAARGEGAGDCHFPRRGPGTAVHRVRRGGAQSPVLPRDGEHGPAVEPDADRAAARPSAPSRSGARRAADQPGRQRHHRGAGPARARGEDQPVRAGSGRARHDPRPGGRRVRLRDHGVRRVRRLGRRRGVRRADGGHRRRPGPSQDRLPGQPRVDRQPGLGREENA